MQVLHLQLYILSFRLHLIYVKLTYPEPPAGLLMDQSLQQGPKMRTQSTEEELSSLMAICVMITRWCFYINLGLCVLLQYVCLQIGMRCAGRVRSVSMCRSGDNVFLPRFPLLTHRMSCLKPVSLEHPSSSISLLSLFFFLVIGESGTKLKPILPFAILPSPPTSIQILFSLQTAFILPPFFFFLSFLNIPLPFYLFYTDIFFFTFLLDLYF